MTDTPKSIPPEQVMGTAKRIHLDLANLTIVDHSAVISLLNTMAQHRDMARKYEQQQAEEKAREDAMAEAQRAHKLMLAQQQAGLGTIRDAKEHGSLILVP